MRNVSVSKCRVTTVVVVFAIAAMLPQFPHELERPGGLLIFTLLFMAALTS